MGHVSAEQLMKYVLYCEWLIYAAWRVENNLSSLLQSVEASEKVFQVMVLMPNYQISSKGKIFLVFLERLVGTFNMLFKYNL